MSVKNENLELKEELVDDVSDVVVTSEPEEDIKLNALKAKMSAKKKEDMSLKIVEKRKRSLEFGVVSLGQGGSRIGEALYNLGYKAICMNTAQVDLEYIKMPNANKLLLEYGIGGAAKSQDLGLEAAKMHRDLIRSKVVQELSDSSVYLVISSLGGGSGSGALPEVLSILEALGKPIIVITILPMTNEDALTKSNALKSLSKLTEEVKNGRVQNLICVDNAKIESIYADLGAADFYKVSNEAIVRPLDIFNIYSSHPSDVKALDPMEFAKILLDGQGLSLYGEMTVANYEDDTALAEAVISNLTSGLLAEGFDLKQTKYAGVMFLANKKVWSEIPSSSINYAMAMVQDHCGTPQGIFRGVYSADIKEDVVKVYSFFSGLALPDSRVEELKKEVAAQSDLLKNKSEARNMNLNLDTGSSGAISEVEKVKERIKANSTAFGKFQKNMVDKRK